MENRHLSGTQLTKTVTKKCSNERNRSSLNTDSSWNCFDLPFSTTIRSDNQEWLSMFIIQPREKRIKITLNTNCTNNGKIVGILEIVCTQLGLLLFKGNPSRSFWRILRFEVARTSLLYVVNRFDRSSYRVERRLFESGGFSPVN